MLNISTLQCSKSFHLYVMPEQELLQRGALVSIQPLTGGLALGHMSAQIVIRASRCAVALLACYRSMQRGRSKKAVSPALIHAASRTRT
jgi:hypothetical protein